MIECTDVTRRFGSVDALRGLTATIPAHSCFALVGPNGAGKTTFLRLLAGVLPMGPRDGSITLRGVPRHGWRAGACAFVPENAPAPGDLSVDQYLASSAMLAGLSDGDIPRALEQAIDGCQLRAVRHRLISLLSRGFRQRVALAAAMVSAPELIVLDEPTSGLDPGQMAVFRSLVSTLSASSTVVLSSHHLGEVGACASHVLVLDSGVARWQGTADALRELGAGSLERAYADLISGAVSR